MAKLSYLSLILTCSWISFFQIIFDDKNAGEFSRFSLNMENYEVFFVILLNSLAFIFFYILSLLARKRKFSLLNKSYIYVNKNRLNIVYLFVLVLQLLFLIFTGVGRLLSEATHPLSPLFAVFSPEAFLPVYYLLCRKNKYKKTEKLFYLNILLFSVFKLLQGWSSFILVLVFLELHSRFGWKKISIRTVALSFVLPLLILVAGGGVYKHVYAFKNEMRGIGVQELSYVEGGTHLASRLSMAPVAIAAYDRNESLVKIFNNDSYSMKEIQGLFRPLLPPVIMPDKNFSPLGNNILEVYYPKITKTTSSNMGLVMYLSTLFLSDTLQALLYIFITLFLLFIAKVFLDTIEQERNQLEFIFFLLLINVVDIASLEIVFGYGFLKIFTIVFIAWLFGGFKVVRYQSIKKTE
jgi:hypothetical protein